MRARAGAIARRVYGDASSVLARCGIAMDLKARTAALKGRPVELTNREFSLLRVFLENPDTVLSRDFLIAAAWKDTVLTSSKVVDVTVVNLRRKLGGDACPVFAVRSLGYKFVSAG